MCWPNRAVLKIGFVMLELDACPESFFFADGWCARPNFSLVARGIENVIDIALQLGYKGMVLAVKKGEKVIKVGSKRENLIDLARAG